jgi:RNA polymerase sigma-70 factor (ECF subfamily)
LSHELTSTSNEELACRAQAGSKECFGELVRRLDGALYNFLLMRTSNPQDAAELCQEAFLRAWQKLERYSTDWKFSTWLFTMAHRLAISHFRGARPRVEGEAALEGIGQDLDPARTLSVREQAGHLWSLAARVLNPDQRSALWLRYGEDLSIEEVARVLGRGPSTVRVQLFRARERLAQHLSAAAEGGRARRREGMLPATPGSVFPGHAGEASHEV